MNGIGEGLSWASRILAVGVAMVLPAAAGSWADERFDTSFLAPVGLVIGFTAGLAWLLQMTRGNRSS